MYAKQYAFINYYHTDHNKGTYSLILKIKNIYMLTSYRLDNNKIILFNILTYFNGFRGIIAMAEGRRKVDAERRLPLPRRIPRRSEARHNKVRCCHQLHLVRYVDDCIE
jgi:hypothetical protein